MILRIQSSTRRQRFFSSITSAAPLILAKRIPKLFMKHIGGHEVYGAIYGREIGDATDEYPGKDGICAALDRLIGDPEILCHLCDRIDVLHANGTYDGAYRCVKLASGMER